MKLIILILLLMESTSSKEDIKKDLLSMGLDEKLVDIAMKVSNNKDEMADLVFLMEDDPGMIQDLSREANKVSGVNVDGGVDKDVYKMVIVVREDLNMSKGKIAAQVGHAVLSAYKISMSKKQMVVHRWETFSGQKKVVLGCEDEAKMIEIQKKAAELGIVYGVVHDAGRTEVKPNTMTCIALGPDLEKEIDKVTGDLKLL